MSELAGESESPVSSSIKGSATGAGSRKLRLGMVGGGRGALSLRLGWDANTC